MAVVDIKNRCQIKTLYTGAEAQCELRWTSVVRDLRNGDTYRCCTNHKKMALAGLVRPHGTVVPKKFRPTWRRRGQLSPYKGRYEEHKKKETQ